MGSTNVPSPAAQAWAIARRSHGIVTRAELLALGFSRQAIEHRLHNGRLYRHAPGVYSVGTPDLTKHGRLMVAVKQCGAGAVLSHLSAAVLWGIWSREPRRITVTVPRRRNPRAAGVQVRRRTLAPEDLAENFGIPVTSPLRTVIDFAAEHGTNATERVVLEADARNVLRADTLRGQLVGRREPGAPLLCAILDRDAFVLTESELERLLVPLALRAGLGRPETQVMVNGHRVDFYFRDIDLVVEANGLRYHRTALQQKKDRLREQAHAAAGTASVAFTHHQIAYEPDYVVATLVSIRSARLAGARPSRGRSSGSRRRSSA